MFLANALRLAKSQRENIHHIGRRCNKLICVILPLKFLGVVSDWGLTIKIWIHSRFSMGTDMIVACASD